MAAPAQACANHPNRDRVAACGNCGSSLCRECVVHTPVGIKCPTCTGERVPAADRRAPTSARRARPTRPTWLVPGAAAAVAVVAALVLVALARSGGGTHERAVHEDDPALDPSVSDSPIERKVELVGGGGTKIGASLQLPAKGATPVAAVLIVPGFGAIDRDSVTAASRDGSADRLSQDLNSSRPGTPDTLFRDLNDNFLSADMATLRYDKRGSGASRLQPTQPLSYDDLVADAKAGLDFLVQRKETATSPVIVVGEDQGGLIAMRLAGDPHVKALVLVSTFGRPLADVIGDDLVAARGEEGQAQSDQVHAVAARLAAGQAVPNPEELLANLRPLFPAAQEGYLRAVFGLDPPKEAAAVKVSTLLVRGARDTTVTAADSDRLRATLAGPSEEMVVPDADHNLGTAGRRDPAMLSQLTAWLRSHAGA